jgi:hypothetical protein
VKRVALLVLLAGGGLAAYRFFVVEAPVRTAQKFLEAWGREDTPAAVALTDGAGAKTSVETHILRGVCRCAMEALHGSRATVASRTDGPGGTAVLTMHQVVAFDPPGITSGIGGAMAASFRQAVTLSKTPAGWRVTAFAPAFVDAVSTRRR